MSYRLMVLPDRPGITMAALRKIRQLVADGAVVIGPKPMESMGLTDYPQCDIEIVRLASEVWGDCDGQKVTENRFGKGRVIWGQSAREVLSAGGVKPDFEVSGAKPGASIDYIHRTDGDTEIYFIANRGLRREECLCSFRVEGKAPEIWDAVTGEQRFAAAYEARDGRVSVPVVLNPCGSIFVVFRESASKHPAQAVSNDLNLQPCGELSGPWLVRFDPKWGGPASIQFETLSNWATNENPGVKFYSGTAIYEKSFATPTGENSKTRRLWIDLGEVRQLAEIKVNGKSAGVVWSPPFRVDITDALRNGDNKLEVEVVNFWPNRIIGDQSLPASERYTRTNVRKLTKDTPLMESGLLGPVRLLQKPAP